MDLPEVRAQLGLRTGSMSSPYRWPLLLLRYTSHLTSVPRIRISNVVTSAGLAGAEVTDAVLRTVCLLAPELPDRTVLRCACVCRAWRAVLARQACRPWAGKCAGLGGSYSLESFTHRNL